MGYGSRARFVPWDRALLTSWSIRAGVSGFRGDRRRRRSGLDMNVLRRRGRLKRDHERFLCGAHGSTSFAVSHRDCPTACTCASSTETSKAALFFGALCFLVTRRSTHFGALICLTVSQAHGRSTNDGSSADVRCACTMNGNNGLEIIQPARLHCGVSRSSANSWVIPWQLL